MQLIQNFKVQGGPEYGRRNLPKLRQALTELGLDGFLVPHEDEYQNEYLPAANERLMWASGFTGSAGAAIVMAEQAAIFVDGRYTIQVQAEVDASLFEILSLENGGVTKWLKAYVNSGHVIGYDPKLHSPDALKTLRQTIESSGGTLKALDNNPIDQAWDDRPPLPLSPVIIQDESYAGESHADKRARIGQIISDKNAEAALITAPASIAWLLNIRGGDVMCTPLPLSTAIIRSDGHTELYINPEKVSEDVITHLGNQVTVYPEHRLSEGLKALAGQTVIADPGVTSAWYFEQLQNAPAQIIRSMDPVALPKACKNTTEINGTRIAHQRDGVAVTNYLYWLDTDAQSGHYDEIDAAQKLETFRHATGVLKDLSFESISGAGSNGAICHYRVSEATTQKLNQGSLFLIDSGGQYVDGTTDVTRTVPIGKPTEEMRERFTLVLKGHIALSVVRFPEGTTGSNLDALARMALWSKGLDYDHGTGHGVGVFLGVHEGPQRISKLPNKISLKPGMIVSNEPGYYKAGEYGIRIENLQFVTHPSDIKGGERAMMGFEYLTLAPIHKGLIIKDLLNEDEIVWLDNYHAEVWSKIGSRVDPEVRDWLKEACAPL